MHCQYLCQPTEKTVLEPGQRREHRRAYATLTGLVTARMRSNPLAAGLQSEADTRA